MAYRDEVLADNPVSYWRLGEAAPVGVGSVIDEQGVNNATPEGGPTFGVAGLISGDANTAADFDGVDDKIDCTAATNLNPENQITVECWIKFTEASTFYRLLVGRDRDPTVFGDSPYAVLAAPGGNIFFGVNTASPASSASITSPGTYNDGVPHHIVAWYSNPDMRLYIDGVLVGSTTWANGLEQRADIKTRIAYQDFVTSLRDYFMGTVDEVAIYSTALSPTRISDHYSAGTTPTVSVDGTANFNGALTASLTANASVIGSTDFSGALTAILSAQSSVSGSAGFNGVLTTAASLTSQATGSVDFSGTVTAVYVDPQAPNQITDLTVTGVTTTSGSFQWSAPYENGGPPPSGGAAISYDFRYQVGTPAAFNYATATQATGEPVPSSPTTIDTFSLLGLIPGTQYSGALTSSDEVSNVSLVSNIVTFTTPISPPPAGGVAGGYAVSPSIVGENFGASSGGIGGPIIRETR